MPRTKQNNPKNLKGESAKCFLNVFGDLDVRTCSVVLLRVVGHLSRNSAFISFIRVFLNIEICLSDVVSPTSDETGSADVQVE